MKSLLLATLALTATTFCPAASTPKAAPHIIGDYVEVRTASVFTGACHYNGELVTTGHEAVMAWNVTAGAWHGVDLAGVRAMAAVSSDANLGDERATRTAELIVDPAASEAQASALASLLREKCGARLGSITSVRRAPVTFNHDAGQFSASSDGYASMTVSPLPDAACCKQPHLVWYSPLTPLDHRKVGFTQSAAYTAGTLGDTWERQGENSAFYGSFTF